MLDPNGGMVIDTPKTQPDSVIINAIGFSVVSQWIYVISPIGHNFTGIDGRNFSFTPAGMSFIMEYYDEDTLFPFQYVDYLDENREMNRVESMLDLPEPEKSPYLIKMREDTKDLLDWSVEVTAIGLDTAGTPAPKESSANFILRVRGDYDVNRDRIKNAIDARRSITDKR